MAQHLTIVCPHGRQIGTCRCPSPIKAVDVVDECPFDCGATSAAPAAENLEPSPQSTPADADRLTPRDALLEELEESWERLNLVLARSENTELFGPLEEVLNGLTALAQVRLPSVDPGTRTGGRGTRREGLSGRFSEHWGTVGERED